MLELVKLIESGEMKEVGGLPSIIVAIHLEAFYQKNLPLLFEMGIPRDIPEEKAKYNLILSLKETCLNLLNSVSEQEGPQIIDATILEELLDPFPNGHHGMKKDSPYRPQDHPLEN